jgi:crossover junction endodeoxyribonuclease RuvC
MTEECILAVNPGVSGAIAFYFPSIRDRVSAEDVPTVAGQICAANLAARLAQMEPTLAIIELVGSMPKQSVASTFKFGKAYAGLRGQVNAI